jgi:hypothetical protein
MAERFSDVENLFVNQPAGGKTVGVPVAENHDRGHAGHYQERGWGCGESGRRREENHRRTTPDGEQGFTQLGAPQQEKKEAEYNVKPGVNRTEKGLLVQDWKNQ